MPHLSYILLVYNHMRPMHGVAGHGGALKASWLAFLSSISTLYAYGMPEDFIFDMTLLRFAMQPVLPGCQLPTTAVWCQTDTWSMHR